jgi:hypothetical protein
LLARYRSVLPSCTVPLVPSRFPVSRSIPANRLSVP